MQTRPFILIASALLAGPGCKDIDCGSGTIEKNGSCVPADETVGTAACGPFTELQGDKCVPMFTPTDCDPTTTTPVVDPTTGVTTCVGTGGGGGCTGAFACPMPTTTSTMTICGQIYDLETDMPFQAASPTGAKCAGNETTGPCALGIKTFDAIDFAQHPTTSAPLQVGSIYIDDCGRYRVIDAALSGPYLAIGVDDAAAANAGPAGVTNTVGVAIASAANTVTTKFEAYMGTKAMTDMWKSSGAPDISAGLFVNIYKAHQVGEADQAGVTFCRQSGASCVAVPNNDYYFTASDTGRHTIDSAASATGMNGTAIVTGMQVTDNCSGLNGLDSTCLWQTHPGASLPNILFVQVKRPQDDFSGDTCDL